MKKYILVDKQGRPVSYVDPLRQRKKLLKRKLGVSGKRLKKILHEGRMKHAI